MTATTYRRGQQEQRRGEGNPRLTAAWKEAVERGIASPLADRIIQARPVPFGLLHLLATGKHYGTRRGNSRTGGP